MIASDKYEDLADALKQVEKQIFEAATIKPEDITDELVNKRLKELRSFVI